MPSNIILALTVKNKVNLHNDASMIYVDVILPLAVPKPYTYAVPQEIASRVKRGQRVVVQFAGKKIYSALVYSIHQKPPENYAVKNIESILDDSPIINEKQFAFWDWISEYYMCSLGEVMNAALPSGLKLSSESNLLLNKELPSDFSLLNDDEFLVAEALSTRESITIEEAGEILGRKKIYPVIKTLLEKKVILIEEELKMKYKPKFTEYVKLKNVDLTEKDTGKIERETKQHFDKLAKAPKQYELLMMFIQLSRLISSHAVEVKKSDLLKAANAGTQAFHSLTEKGIFEIYSKESIGINNDAGDPQQLNPLNQHQADALKKINGLFAVKEVVLLHGVTSSGKTEIYVRGIEEMIKNGKQVLYLLPEIALTTQLITRLSKYFGATIGVYHSRYSSNERIETVRALAAGKINIILGARSALFLPYSNLGLIIVDEEHENSFKQYDPAPRYHARDAALVLAKIHGAKTLLGSATPSIESYHNAENGKYGLAELPQRYGGIQLPEMVVLDVKEATRKKLMKSHFSPELLQEMQLNLERKKQVILFQNRRGFAPYMQCDTCNTVPQCKRCDVRLTYHKHFNELRCHYCGYKLPFPKACMACGDTGIKLKGFGTEKIEEELLLFFPNAKVNRLDLDSTRSKNAYRQIITDFEDRNIDILVGTQMVTKGLDFDHVGLVGILNADNMLYFPDFRANERSFQLMAQVAGRSGRKNSRGKVMIQTYSPAHPVINQVVHHDFSGLYKTEINDRKNYGYPPFVRLIELTLKERTTEKLNEAAEFFAGNLRKKFGSRVLGPEAPLIGRVKNFYLKKILLKIEKGASGRKAKEIINEELVILKKDELYKSVRIAIDVDPY